MDPSSPKFYFLLHPMGRPSQELPSPKGVRRHSSHLPGSLFHTKCTLYFAPSYRTKEPAPPFVAADPDARKYDGARVLCKSCSSWIFVGQDSQAAQAWSQHRAQCRPALPPVPPAAPTIPRFAHLSLSPVSTSCYLH